MKFNTILNIFLNRAAGILGSEAGDVLSFDDFDPLNPSNRVSGFVSLFYILFLFLLIIYFTLVGIITLREFTQLIHFYTQNDE